MKLAAIDQADLELLTAYREGELGKTETRKLRSRLAHDRKLMAALASMVRDTHPEDDTQDRAPVPARVERRPDAAPGHPAPAPALRVAVVAGTLLVGWMTFAGGEPVQTGALSNIQEISLDVTAPAPEDVAPTITDL